MSSRLSLRALFSRLYSTRLPEKPPYRAPDPLINNPHAVYKPLPDDLTLIYRPPPTAPTPFSYTSSPASPLLRNEPSPLASAPLPPAMRAEKVEPPRVSQEVMDKIRELRRNNPQKWTAGKLAKKFGCNQGFVYKIAALKPRDRKKILAARDAEHDRFRARWGEKKALQVEIRKKRKEFW